MSSTPTTTHGGPPIREFYSRLLGWRDSFLDSLQPRLPRTVILSASGLTLLAFAIYASLSPDAFEPGDAPMYADRISRLGAFVQPYHMGYNLVGIAFTRLVPLPIDQAMNVMSAFFGALCVGLVCTIAYTLVGRLSAGVAASVLLASTYLFAENSTQAELYIVQLFFFLLCVQLILSDKPVLAGLAFVGACLVTPSTVLAAPFLVLLRPRMRFTLTWTATAAAILLVFIAPFAQGYLWGPGSLSEMTKSDLTLTSALAKDAGQLWEFNIGLVLAAVGVVSLGRKPRYWILLAGIGLLWLVPFVLGERFSDVPVQMPLYAIVAVLAGIGFAWLLSAWGSARWLAALGILGLAAAVVVAAQSSYSQISLADATIVPYKAAILDNAAIAQPGEVGIGQGWSLTLVSHYLGGRSNPTLILSDDLSGSNGAAVQAENVQKIDAALAAKRRIWLLDFTIAPIEGNFTRVGYRIVQSGPLTIAVPPGAGQ